MGARARKLFIRVFLLLLGALTACGKEEDAVEYGVDGYVYLSKQLYALEGVEELNVFGDYLYLTRDEGSRRTVERLPISSMMSNEGSLNFTQKEEVLAASFVPFVLPEGAQEALEEYDFTDIVEGKGASGYKPEEEERVYCLLTLNALAADQEQNVYYVLGLTMGTMEEMEVGGNLLCRRTAEGELSYWKYLPEIRDIAVDGEGRVCVLTSKEIMVMDEGGALKKSVSVDRYHNEDGGDLDELFMDSEGRVFYCIRGKDFVWRSFELSVKDGVNLQDAGAFLGSYTNHAAASEGNIFLFSKDSSNYLYKYNKENGTTKEILCWSHSGMLNYKVRSVAEITPEHILVSYGDGIDRSLYQLTRTSKEEAPQRVTLILASAGDAEMQKIVTSFNESNEKYRILMDDYGAEFSDYGAMYTRLDAALVSSNPPDLIDFGYMDISKYAEQGALEDLAPYLEKSSVLDREDYLDNALEGMTIDGRLVCIPSGFDLKATVGRTSQVVNLGSWSMEDVYGLTDAHPEAKSGLINDCLGEMAQRDYFLRFFCSCYYLEKFVDWEKCECDFDSEAFRRLIVWAGDYAWEPEQKAEQIGSVTVGYEYIPKNALLAYRTRTHFNSMVLFQILFGEDVTLLGFPTVDGKGVYPVRVTTALSICAKSPYKEAAWEFMEYYLTENGMPTGQSFSTRKDLIQKEYEMAITPVYKSGYIEGGNEAPEMKELGIWPVGEEVFPYYVIPKEQADMVLHAVETADFSPIPTVKSMIADIIVEEAESYYSGDKNLEEVTGIIQNRVQLLLQEQKK